MPASLIHPKLLDRLGASGFFPDRATVEEYVSTRTASGAETLTPTPLPGHSHIPAAVSPLVFTRVGESRMTQLTVGENTHRIALRGAFPAITSRMRLVVTGRHPGIYDITRHDLDSQAGLTVLEARIVSPVAQAGV